MVERDKTDFGSIRPGDRVMCLVFSGLGRNGAEYTKRIGKVVMRGPAGWVLNMGGKYGTAQVCSESNFVRISRFGR